jgi:hypothetical protein
MKIKKSLLLLIIITSLFACKKDPLDNNISGKLKFSNDTIIFDTSFHSIGTPTKILTVYNQNNFNITTNVLLSSSNNGVFRMNIDGEPVENQKEIEIASNDSIFIFLEATANINLNNEFLLTSNIKFISGDNNQTIQLVVPARNANFHLPNDNFFFDGTDSINFKYYSISENEIWTNNLPHVVYGYVVIEPEATLTIEEGTEIYFHNNSGIFVGNPILSNQNSQLNDNGTLIVNGSLNNKVIFKGDRLDSWYENIPGQWNGIHFVQGSINNIINHAIISNGINGIRADSVSNNNPTVEINNTIIKNISNIGILGQGATINVTNTLITKCGQYSVACNIGGSYTFTHCTFANYWDYNRRSTPTILLNNYYNSIDGTTYIRDLEKANFKNCIIDGPLTTEISFDEYQEIGLFNYKFEHCIIKIDPTTETENLNYINSIFNEDVKFIDASEDDFHLKDNSPAVNTADISTILLDLDGVQRNIPDIGAYELID